jgi:hypothetical protein
MGKIAIIMLFCYSLTGDLAYSQSTGTIVDSIEISSEVPVYEYVPKVIIEGKWGRGPGEFGVAWTYAHDVTLPESPSGSMSEPIYPGSLAVDSKGDIYILDTVNNRIQKFDKEGKYLLSIEVESYAGNEQPIWYGKVKREDGSEGLDVVDSKDKQGNIIGVDRWFPFYWPITVQGINIVIDSKDNLYYYLKRIKDGKESGEVWEFNDDKLVRKWEVPYFFRTCLDERDDALWLTKYPIEYVYTDDGEDYNILEKKTYLRKTINDLTRSKYEKIGRLSKKSNSEMEYYNLKFKKIKKITPLRGETFVSDGIFNKKGFIITSSDKKEEWLNYFDFDGKLIQRIRVKGYPYNGKKDREENLYEIFIESDCLKVFKYQKAIFYGGSI